MNYAEICIIKRDGKREDFSISKIKNAISKAFSATGIQDEQQLVADITMNVISQFTTPTITVEEIQDLVEKSLMKVRPEVAKKYIIYREWRNTERDKKTQMKQVMDGIVAIDKNDVNLSNANMSSHTPAGQMMTFASEVTKDYTYKYLLPKRFAEAHQLGDIHIHDLDYYPTKIQRLDEKGYVLIVPNAKDKRKKNVYLTEKAYDIQRRMEADRRRIDKNLTLGMTRREVQALQKMLNRVLYNVSDV